MTIYLRCEIDPDSGRLIVIEKYWERESAYSDKRIGQFIIEAIE